MSEVIAALEQLSTSPAAERPSIAVLPFANLSRNAEDDYFSDGLAEEILNLLAKIPGLNVTARTSSFAFRGKEQDITAIAAALRVRAVLEGSVRRAGSRIRVTAQLIDAADGYHLWSERYDRELTDVFAVQDEIAAAIADALELKLAARTPAPRPQPGLAAYEAFLNGRYHLLRSSPEAFERAREYFEQAIALDPLYAAPHAELGYHYLLLATQGLRRSREAIPAARAEAEKALQLDPAEPRAHVTLCGAAAFHDFDWKKAGEHFRLTLAAEPVPPEARLRAALFYLAPQGRYEETLRHFESALEQDPLNVIFRAIYALQLAAAGCHERAIEEAAVAAARDRSLWLAHYAAATGFPALGRFEEGREAAERAMAAAPWQPLLPGLLAGMLVACGRVGEAEALLARRRDTSHTGLLLYRMFRGEFDAALDEYVAAIEEREPMAVFMARSATLAPLREQPRWDAIERLLNLR